MSTLRIRNSALWWVTGGALAFLCLALGVPFLRSLFSFELIHPLELAACLGAGLVSILISESIKLPFIRRWLGAK